MKKLWLALILFCISGGTALRAQDTVRVKVLGKNMVTVVESGNRTDVKVGNNAINVKDGHYYDTVKVRVGRKALIIVDGEHGSDIKVNHLNDEEYESWTGHRVKFKGHWAIFEMGVNSFANVDYTGFPPPNFMDLNENKSFEVGLNFLRYSIGLQKYKKNIGLVTGLGMTFNDYRFANPYTIRNDAGMVKPVELEESGLSKSKLSTIFLSVPLMLEFQIPVNGHSNRFYVSGGMIGGLKLSSHTKVKQNDQKSKDHDDFNINPFRYGTTARIGYRGINIFGTYYFSTLFKSGRGPEMFPFTIGIGLIN
jgi:hypothetical protein